MEEHPTRPLIIAVEGNIGCGKSTMMRHFQESEQKHIEVCPEPVDLWTDLNGHNLLGQCIEEPGRWGFLFQSYVQLTRVDQLQARTTTRRPIRMLERSLQSNRFCYQEVHKARGTMSEQELEVLKRWYTFLESSLNLDLDLIIYLQTDPDTAYQRMRSRNRREEAGAKYEYIVSLHQAYQSWLVERKFGRPPAPVLVIDGNLEHGELVAIYQHIEDQLRSDAYLLGSLECLPGMRYLD